jgi:putative acetyltransferase|tara:strand:+ start:66 stop:533 length:468 start_codon:yes stop_codon:yes gene_type:complete
MLKSIEGNFDNLEVHELLIKHFIELRSVSPKGSAHVLDVEGLKDPSIKFWSLWEKNDLMGSGALKFLDKEHGEFKSIRISDKFRGQGNGQIVINHLINEAKRLNIKRLSLETGAGDFFLAARKLFNRSGFELSKPFSHYKNDVNSVYMTMLISNK